MQTLVGLLPIIILFIFPLLSSLFSGSSQPTSPRMVFEHPEPPYTMQRTTPNLRVNYFVNPQDVAQMTKFKLGQLDRTAEVNLVRGLRMECANEENHRQALFDAAQGWFYEDPEKMDAARNYAMPSCKRLDDLGVAKS
jgi:DnaJ homolog subfamily B member 12